MHTHGHIALIVTCAVCLAVSSSPSLAQTAPLPKSGADIVVNPTLAECGRGWQENATKKWSKEQFDHFCAVLTTPAEVVANPTLEECSKGWNKTLRWTEEQFATYCARLRSNK
jgi:hypothetical protein